MPLRFNLLEVAPHVMSAVALVIVIVVHHVAEKAVEMVEAPANGVVLASQAEVPLANQRSVVTGSLQHLWQQRRILRKVSPIIVRVRADNARYADQLGVTSSLQRGSCRRADRAVRIGVSELDAGGNEAICIWRLQIRRTVAGQVPVAEVIRKDEQDIGLVTTLLAGDQVARQRDGRGTGAGCFEQVAPGNPPVHASTIFVRAASERRAAQCLIFAGFAGMKPSAAWSFLRAATASSPSSPGFNGCCSSTSFRMS